MDNSGPITVLLDSQAAIARLRHIEAGPRQELALRAHSIARALQERGRDPVIHLPNRKLPEGPTPKETRPFGRISLTRYA
jgi:hypothetical protein